MRSEAGFTLIEMMLVVVISAMLVTSAVVGFGSVRRGRLRVGASHVASAMRFAYVHALTTGRPTRVVFTVGRNQIWIEESQDAHTLDVNDPLRAGGAESDAEATEENARREAQLMAEMRPRAPRAEFRRPEGNRYRTRELGTDVVIQRLFTAHSTEPREEGNGYVYFWGGGVSERAVVQLRGANGEVFSVVLHPLTGRPEIFDREVEPPVVDDSNATDQNEIDARQEEVRSP